MTALATSPEQHPSSGTIVARVGRWARKRASTILWILLVIAVKYIVPQALVWPLSWVAVGLIALRLGRNLLRERPLPGHMLVRHLAAAALLIVIAMPRVGREALIESGGIALPVGIIALHIGVGLVRGILRARATPADLRKRVAAFLACLLPERLATFAATDINLLSYVIPGLRRRDVPPGYLAFNYHQQIRPILLVFISLAAIEAVVGHLMLIRAAPAVRWTVFVISDLGLLYFVALAASLSKLPLLVSTDRVVVRAGIFIEVDIPVEAITHVQGISSEEQRRRPGSVNTALMSQPSVFLEFSRQIPATIPVKGEKQVWRAGVRPDDPVAFIAAVEGAIAAYRQAGGLGAPAGHSTERVRRATDSNPSPSQQLAQAT